MKLFGGGRDAERAAAEPGLLAGQPRSTEGQLVYAIGDVHGCYGLLKNLLTEIARDRAERARGRVPMLVFLGDYVDRGPDSAKVVQALVWLARRGGFALRLLKGNHEQGLLDFLHEPEQGAAWLSFGGAETLVSYGVTPPDAREGHEGLLRARDALLDSLPASHLQLLDDLELLVTVGDYAFAHAGVRPETPLEAQTEADLLWIRKGFLDVAGPFERMIVHGHTWVDAQPQMMEHRMGVDTGAYATGVLTAVRIDGAEVQVLQARR
jgi:serine/threonine protein phosphatase 1